MLEADRENGVLYRGVKNGVGLSFKIERRVFQLIRSGHGELQLKLMVLNLFFLIHLSHFSLAVCEAKSKNG
jgi:hypothetical protein